MAMLQISSAANTRPKFDMACPSRLLTSPSTTLQEFGSANNVHNMPL